MTLDERSTVALIEMCLSCYRACLGTAMTHCLEAGAKHTEPAQGDLAKPPQRPLPLPVFEALAMFAVILPDRVADFKGYYESPRPVKELNWTTYTIKDYLRGQLSSADMKRKSWFDSSAAQLIEVASLSDGLDRVDQRTVMTAVSPRSSSAILAN